MIWYFYRNKLLTIYKNKLLMKNFFKNLFSNKKNNEEKIREELEGAVRTDDVQKAFSYLKAGADVNMKIFYTTEVYVDSYEIMPVTKTSCLLELAYSEPMKRLLRHFGALSLQELEKIWKQEEDERNNKHLQLLTENRKQEEERIRQKAEADNCFLDSVLR